MFSNFDYIQFAVSSFTSQAASTPLHSNHSWTRCLVKRITMNVSGVRVCVCVCSLSRAAVCGDSFAYHFIPLNAQEIMFMCIIMHVLCSVIQFQIDIHSQNSCSVSAHYTRRMKDVEKYKTINPMSSNTINSLLCCRLSWIPLRSVRAQYFWFIICI